MTNLSVVIGTFNQKDSLKLVLESFTKQTYKDFEIIVVDSSSTDGTEEIVRTEQCSVPTLQYIRQENNGKTAARNRGIKEAKGEIILLTDADMIADSQLVEEHIKAHKKYNNACFEGTTFNFLKKGSDAVEPYIKQKLRAGQKLKWAYFLSGNLSIKKETLIKAGMFDEDFKSYGWEDIELGYRLHKMKIPLYYLPSAKNYHYHFVTDNDMVKRKYNMGKSAAIFYKKHPNFEIKMFLGMNPLAMGIYRFLKKYPRFLKLSQYLREEFEYRKGLEA
ncbi:hypothetical protein A2276_08280 [candidate division WOR-1 bacterium RIFOXYA12_FULL_43_27]|uniref:Glycosyltransferase 2-like domain-containing protein n=1 Tax=candidate division WOR-1 bacterium RIFOXYC2_FULL_46_14 TaxID=1802587 RepID=A0A1F4U682_UNCSA|nr:MAG: hypothetical protein A2276_08280 [candidate division WOR-1 bacterium RIFOXYA12_FULL_43_27]OGC20591.1 MAG: hypothetical protein A2292_06105 [candidate division WOR-1 bacterium RIFOXYB2_FULL_46_45]OGC31672.1 MAG: hypothetical protein A2232_05345 [candidate division WOR-1 bacterium RIFOXYA2_FULL_46_56]OGC40432.1 MAG: hypothetical protein A2438_04135 [candidate division WOR-1 bacterium RIFOXYC2_FULL_46_14]